MSQLRDDRAGYNHDFMKPKGIIVVVVGETTDPTPLVLTDGTRHLVAATRLFYRGITFWTHMYIKASLSPLIKLGVLALRTRLSLV